MSAAQFTPGPWAYADALWSATNTAYTVYGAAQLSQPVADVLKTTDAQANARLIAAAPDLLAALVRMSECYARLVPPGYPKSDAEKHAAEVIAKATGSAL